MNEGEGGDVFRHCSSNHLSDLLPLFFIIRVVWEENRERTIFLSLLFLVAVRSIIVCRLYIVCDK